MKWNIGSEVSDIGHIGNFNFSIEIISGGFDLNLDFTGLFRPGFEVIDIYFTGE